MTMKFIPNKPHFFQPVLPDFKHGLSIPISFIKRYLKGYKLEQIELRRGNKKWGIKVKNERILEEGWLKFVEDSNLNIGDFLVFKHKGSLVFEVLIFDNSALLKPSSIVKQEIVDDDGVRHSEPIFPYPKSCNDKVAGSSPLKITAGGGYGGHPYFTATLGPSNIRYSVFSIPMKFARTHELLNKREIILMGEIGTPVSVKLRRNRSHLTIGDGFREFHTENELKVGDSVIVHLRANGKTPIMNLKRLNNTTHKKQECNKVVLHGGRSVDIKKIGELDKGKALIKEEYI